MTIHEYDERLYRLLKRCLFGNYVSTSADELTLAMRRGMLRNVDDATVGKACACGDDDCRSFDVANASDAESSFRIRFHVEGELSVQCDSAGRLKRVEWLPQSRGARKRRCYTPTAPGWAETPIATV
jgi:hypothetical protein